MRRNIDWNDKDARRAYDREYYALKRKEYQKEYRKAYYEANKEKIREYHKKRYKPREVTRTEPPVTDNVFEEWKDINENYSISNYGKVWSKRYRRFLRCKPSKGYTSVHIGRKWYYIHRLVAEAFIPNPYNLPEVDHIDTNPQNNVWMNLRWVDRIGNQNNETTKKKMSKSKKETGISCIEAAIASCRKAVCQYTKDGEFIKEYPSVRITADETGVNKASIAACCRGNKGRKTAGGFIWKFTEKEVSYRKSAS